MSDTHFCLIVLPTALMGNLWAVRFRSTLFNNSQNLNLQKAALSSAGERYKIQFNKLESYEAEYADLSTKFKSNSEIIKNLKLNLSCINLLKPKKLNTIIKKFKFKEVNVP